MRNHSLLLATFGSLAVVFLAPAAVSDGFGLGEQIAVAVTATAGSASAAQDLAFVGSPDPALAVLPLLELACIVFSVAVAARMLRRSVPRRAIRVGVAPGSAAPGSPAPISRAPRRHPVDVAGWLALIALGILVFEYVVYVVALSSFSHMDTQVCPGSDTFCFPDGRPGITGGTVVFVTGNLLGAALVLTVGSLLGRGRGRAARAECRGV